MKMNNKISKLSPIFLILISLFLMELVFRFYYRNESTSDLWKNVSGNYIRNWESENNCSYTDSIIIHPTLGYVYRQKEYLPKDCIQAKQIANNIGIYSKHDLPINKNIDEFRILVTGGSVAQILANYYTAESNRNGFRNYLEYYFNKHFVPPKGKKFAFYNGAAGGWAYPNQLTMTIMYAERIDAVLAISGYNETFKIRDGQMIEQIWGATTIIASTSIHSFTHKYLRLLSSYKKFVKKSSLMRSYLAFAIFEGAQNLFMCCVVTPGEIEEFSSGGIEQLKLPIDQRRAYALKQYEEYVTKMHAIAKALNLKSAEFLQPNRLKGKSLTIDEKIAKEHHTLADVEAVESMYLKLEKKGFPIGNLTYIFQNERESIYADHIHYISKNGRSKGNEILTESISKKLKQLWQLKSKKAE